MSRDTLLSIGEALIDFIPEQVGCHFSEVQGFHPAVGGAPANVCGAFVRLGGKARLLTQLGADPFGAKIAGELAGFGIDTSAIRYTTDANTSLAFVSLAADGNRTFSFYRNPAADMLYAPEQVDPACFTDGYALHFCSVSLGEFPMRDAHRTAIGYARESDMLISFDPNLRFPLWPDRDALHRAVWEFLPQAHILKISDEELPFLTGETDIHAALPKLFTGSVQIVIYTCGGGGAYAFTRTAQAFAAAQSIAATDTTGAGDGFIGSLLYQLHRDGVTLHTIGSLDAQALEAYLTFSHRFCGISVRRSGAIASYPTLREMQD